VSDAASASSLLVVSRQVLNESDNSTFDTGDPEKTIVTYPPHITVLASSLIVRVLFDPSTKALDLTELADNRPAPGLKVKVEFTLAEVIVPDEIPVNATSKSLLADESLATVEPALVNWLPSPTNAAAVTVPLAVTEVRLLAAL
jgi:hypothetical protein